MVYSSFSLKSNHESDLGHFLHSFSSADKCVLILMLQWYQEPFHNANLMLQYYYIIVVKLEVVKL